VPGAKDELRLWASEASIIEVVIGTSTTRGQIDDLTKNLSQIFPLESRLETKYVLDVSNNHLDIKGLKQQRK